MVKTESPVVSHEGCDRAAVDNFIVCSGDILFRPNFTAYEHSPKLIVQDLEKLFQIADEIPLKMLRGEQLTEDEMSPLRSRPCMFALSSVDGVEGLKRVHEWFELKKALAAAARA